LIFKMKPRVRILGTELLVANCNLMPPKVRKAAENELLKIAYIIDNDGKEMCPVKTGRLRASNTVNWTGSAFVRAKPVGGVGGEGAFQGINDGVGRPGADLKGFWVAIGTNVAYAQEVHDRIPYLWAAMKKNEASIKMRLTTAIARGLR